MPVKKLVTKKEDEFLDRMQDTLTRMETLVKPKECDEMSKILGKLSVYSSKIEECVQHLYNVFGVPYSQIRSDEEKATEELSNV
jgi:hypothetical protein